MPADGFTKLLSAEKHSHFVSNWVWLISHRELIQNTVEERILIKMISRSHLFRSEICGVCRRLSMIKTSPQETSVLVI